MSKVQWKISGKRVAVPPPTGEWTFEQRPGGWIIAERATPGGVERRRFALSLFRARMSASLGGRLWHGDWAEVARAGAGTSGSDADLIAQFPGKVRKILVESGQKVVEGESLLLVEAMKMEFAIKAPFDGTVAKILVQEGQQLSPGDRFVDLQPAETK